MFYWSPARSLIVKPFEVSWLFICEPMQSLRTEAVSCLLILLIVCSLMQPLPAHPDTAADILCQKRKIALARDREIRKDCHDMHVVFWVKIRVTKPLEEFLLWAFRELSLEHVVFESDTIKTWELCRQQNYLPHINWVFWEAKMCSKKQNSNWDGERCRGPFQTWFASGTSCTS